MKFIDKFLRSWRVWVALRHAPKQMTKIFDIGCDDGFLLKKLVKKTTKQDGCDPLVQTETTTPSSQIMRGCFPAVVKNHMLSGEYDAIFALAVFEHFSEQDLQQSAAVIQRMLSPTGRLILSVPHPFVDKILDVLLFLKLIDGQALDEHHGFDPEQILTYFSGSLRCIRRKRFQLGLNNIFVFQRN